MNSNRPKHFLSVHSKQSKETVSTTGMNVQISHTSSIINGIPKAVYRQKYPRVNIYTTYIYRSQIQPGANTSYLFGGDHSSTGHVNSRTWWTRLSIVTCALLPEDMSFCGATFQVIAICICLKTPQDGPIHRSLCYRFQASGRVFQTESGIL